MANNIHTIRTFTPRPFLQSFRHGCNSPHSHSPSITSLASVSPPPPSSIEEDDTDRPSVSVSNGTSQNPKPKTPFFPKTGQTLELVCESLAFKGKGLCKVSETGFVLMCDRALPGERFLGRVTRRKGSYAEMLRYAGMHFNA